MFGSSLPPVCLYCPVMSAMISAYTRCSVRLYLQFVCIVLLCPLRFQHTHDVRFVFTSSLFVLSCYVHYDFSIHTMFGSSLPPVCLYCPVMSITISAYTRCSVRLYLQFVCIVLLCPLRFQHTHHVRFVFTSSLFVLSCYVHYDFSIHTMFGSSLPPVCLYCPVMSAMISAYTRCSVRLYLQFVCIVLLCPLRFQHTHHVRFVFTSSLFVLSCYVHYDFSIHTMFGSSLPPVCLYCPVMSAMISAYTRCSVRLYLQFVCIVLLCPLRFQHTHDVRFVFTSSLFVLSCYVHYDFSIHTMFGSSLPPVCLYCPVMSITISAYT